MRNRWIYGTSIVLWVACGSETPGESAQAAQMELGIVIAEPSGEDEWVTLQDRVSMDGFVFGDAQRVWWETDKGASGEINLDEDAWSIRELPIPVGLTTITLRAADGEHERQDQLRIRRNGELLYNEAPQMDSPAVFIDRDERMRVWVELTTRSGKMPAQLRLERVDSSGKVTQLATLVDNGNLVEGDDIQSDGTYSAYVTFKETVEGVFYLRAAGPGLDGQDEYSASRDISAVADFKEGELEHMNLVIEEGGAAFDAALDEGKKPADAAAIARDALLARPNVSAVSLGDSNYSLAVQFKNGAAGLIDRTPAGTKGGASRRTCGSEHASDEVACVDHALSSGGAGLPENFGALLLSPFQDELENTENAHLSGLLKASTCPHYRHEGVYENKKASFGITRELGNFGLVSIDTHGNNFSHFKYDPKTMTSQAFRRSDNAYSKSTLLVLRGGADKNSLANAGVRKAMKEGAYLVAGENMAITAVFFKRWVKRRLPRSLVMLSACNSATHPDIVDSLISRGARAVLGYKGTVTIGFTQDRSAEFFDCMFGKSSHPDNLPTASACYKYKESWNLFEKASAFVISPKNHDMRLVGGSTLVNGDFDQKGRYWETGGDARFLASFGAARATGHHMAFLSTGLGFTKGHGVISQMMCLKDQAYSRLKFRFKLYSAEFKKYCDVAGFDDTFRVVAQAGQNKVIFPKSNGIGDDPGYQITEFCNEQLQPSDVKMPEIKVVGGEDRDTDGTFMTDWQDADIDISEVTRAGSLNLRFEVVDRGDSAFDTAVLIDDVRLE